MLSELRKDIVSGDWILIAPGRGKRPDEFSAKTTREVPDIKKCPFEPDMLSEEVNIASFPSDNNWRVKIIPNKYPAVYSIHDLSKEDLRNYSKILKNGPYPVKRGYGHHDLVITKDHEADYSDLSMSDAELIFEAFRDRYNQLAKHRDINYVGIFHNFGPKAGASVYHPHYQIIAVSVVPPDVSHSLSGSSRYFLKNKKCVHCEILAWEMKEKKRIIYENDSAVAFAPYVSRSPFEVRVFPKLHLPYFEDTPQIVMQDMALAVSQILKRIKKSLDPDYNFFIHTSPILSKEKYAHYHWHIEILPKISISAGFELETGILINVMDPDQVAEHFRNQKI